MNQEISWNKRDFIAIEALSVEEIEIVLSVARAFKKALGRSQKKLPSLRGKQIVNLFQEPSTRTRIAFETAATRLSADVINLDGGSSSVKKGETLCDTVRVIEALKADMIVVRHAAAGAPQFISECVGIPVINAGDGAHEHPTQAMLDAFTIQEAIGEIKGKRITILGDILFSRVARSNIWALTKLGARVTVAGPATLAPKAFESMGVRVLHDADEALADADVVMLLRIQHERQTATHFPSIGEYRALFGLNQSRLKKLKPDALIMHPGPINRGAEIDSEIADSGRSLVFQQVTNGVAVRMAVLYLCAAASAQQELNRAPIHP